MKQNEMPKVTSSAAKQEQRIQEPQIKVVNFETPGEEVLRILKEERIVSLDLNLTAEERESIRNFKIENGTSHLNYFGNVDSSDLASSLNLYLKSIGENSDETIEKISRLVKRMAEGLAQHFDTKFVWIDSKSMLPNDYFITPRWHTDAKFYNPLTAYKLVMAIKGPQTRFGSTAEFEKFVQLSIDENKEKHGSEEDIRIRKELDLIVNEVQMPSKENPTLYLVSSDDAYIHSEPHIDEERIFIAIVAGTEDEINEWSNRTEQKKLRKKSKEEEGSKS